MKSNQRKATGLEQEAFHYLNELKESGELNMFGSTSYVMNQFGHDKPTSKRLVQLWMKNFNEDSDYSIIKD